MKKLLIAFSAVMLLGACNTKKEEIDVPEPKAPANDEAPIEEEAPMRDETPDTEVPDEDVPIDDPDLNRDQIMDNEDENSGKNRGQ